jgi:hypothetical protein
MGIEPKKALPQEARLAGISEVRTVREFDLQVVSVAAELGLDQAP